MTPAERKKLQDLDDMILRATESELKRMQEMDYQTQLDCLPFYDVCVDSAALVNTSSSER